MGLARGAGYFHPFVSAAPERGPAHKEVYVLMDRLKTELAGFEKKFGLEVKVQRSLEWHRARLGCVTASEASCLLADRSSQKYRTYLHTKAAECLTAEVRPGPQAASLAWGKAFEDEAREAVADALDADVLEFPLIVSEKRGYRAAASPDGVVKGEDAGVEIKCPWQSHYHIEARAGWKPAYVKQVQFSLWLTGSPRWFLASYDPRLKWGSKLHMEAFEPDPKIHKRFDAAMASWNENLNGILKRAAKGFSFGDQWKCEHEITKPPMAPDPIMSSVGYMQRLGQMGIKPIH